MPIGPLSQPGASARLPTPPTAVSASAVAGGGATVSFTASENLGKPTGDYLVTSSPSGITASGTSTSISVTGLTGGTAYTFSVIRRSGSGISSPASSPSSSITAFAVPSAGVATLSTNGCDTATWSFSATNNGSSITKWEYQVSTDNGTTWGTAVETTSASYSRTVTYDTASYVVRVRAFNSAGWGTYGTKSSGTTAWTRETREVTDTDTSCGTECSSTSTSSISRFCGTCGSESGTRTTTGTRTRSRTRTLKQEKFTRSGCTTKDWTTYETGAYSDWTYSAWTYTNSDSWSGVCSEVACCGTGWTYQNDNLRATYGYNTPFSFGGNTYIIDQFGIFADTPRQTVGDCSRGYALYSCNANTANTLRFEVINFGC